MINVVGYIRDTAWDKMIGVEYYRCFLPLREVNSRAGDVEAKILDAKIVMDMPDGDWGHFDVYHWSRMSHGDCEAFVEAVHNRGAKFTIDADDDLTETYKLVTGRGEAFKHVLRHVDHLTCSTQALANELAQYTKAPPTVLKNHIDTDWFVETANKAKRVIPGLTIGFSGSPTHWGDWYIPAVPLARIVRDFEVTPILHGECPRYLDFVSEDVVKLGGVPYSTYPILLRQFDIVLCAVDPDDRYNAGKSAVKALECMAVGAVPVCSRFAPYVELYEAGAPVVLVEENSRDGWYEAMRYVIQDEIKRLELWNAGRDWVKANRDMCVSGYEQWADFYRRITDDNLP